MIFKLNENRRLIREIHETDCQIQVRKKKFNETWSVLLEIHLILE